MLCTTTGLHARMKHMVSLIAGSACLLIAQSAGAAEATPRDMEAYFKGKTINYIIGQNPGGGYDLRGRIASKYLPKYLPGNPRVLIVNVDGAGHLRGSRQLQASKPDGLTIGETHHNVFRRAFRENIDGFDIYKVRYVGYFSAADHGDVACARKEVATSWDQVVALKRPLKYGITGNGGEDLGSLAAELIARQGGPIKIISGYTGTAEKVAALMRGEIEAMDGCHTIALKKFPDLVGKVAPLYWMIAPLEKSLWPLLGYPEPPHFYDVWKMNDATKTVIDTLVLVRRYSGMITLPPGTPDDLYAVWLKAVKDLSGDPEFLQELVKAGDDPSYGGPDAVSAMLEKVRTLPESEKKLLGELMPD
jgi:tripartite-type tricarboxylate transporter receptor subunit TctC